MMRWIRLASLALFGYVLYELVQALGRRPAGQADGHGMGRVEEHHMEEATGRMNITGTGRGTTVSTEDAAGTSVPHIVGRGVTRS